MKVIGSFEKKDVLEATLIHGNQQVSILNYGCVVRAWKIDLAAGVRDVVLGFDSFEHYPVHSPSFGIIAGRVANRTAFGRFTDGEKHYQLDQNNGQHHLHGGAAGLGKRIWDMEVDDSTNTVVLGFRSQDGDQGYPGDVDFRITYTLDQAGLHCEMKARPTARTPINLAQHNYYNLAGGSDILDHQLWVDADRYMPVDTGLIPTGEMLSVSASRYDFTQSQSIVDSDPQKLGIDNNLVLRDGRDRDVAAAILDSPNRDLRLEIVTDQPGIQLYTAALLNVPVSGYDGRMYTPFGGVCLEPQSHPDSLNNPGFPSIFHTPENPYRQNLTMRLIES